MTNILGVSTTIYYRRWVSGRKFFSVKIGPIMTVIPGKYQYLRTQL